MKPVHRLCVHAALLGVAVVGALIVWTRDPDAASSVGTNVRVWGGKPADVQKIEVESKPKHTVLEARSDSAGRWFEGTVVSTEQPRRLRITTIRIILMTPITKTQR
jgi:hypothetical protein